MNTPTPANVTRLLVEWGRVFYRTRQYDRAIAQYRKILELYANNDDAHCHLGIIFSQQGRHKEALSELRQAFALDQHHTNRAWLAYGYARAGQPGEALQILRELEERAARERVSPVYIARIYTGLEDKDRAFEWLHKAYAERSDHLLGMGADPAYDALRADRRFAKLLRSIGLAP